MLRDLIIINGLPVTGIDRVICTLMRTLTNIAETIHSFEIQRLQIIETNAGWNDVKYFI